MSLAKQFRGTFGTYALLLLSQRFMLGITFYAIVSSLFLQSRGLNYKLIFGLESVLAVALFFFEVPSGVWADRFDRKKVLFIGNALNVVATWIFASSYSYWMFVLSFVLAGLGIATLSGTDSAYIFELLKRTGREKDSTKVFGWLSVAEKVTTLVALPVGSLIAVYGVDWPVYATAVANTIGLLLLLPMPSQRVRQEDPEEGGSFVAKDWAVIRESVRLILCTPSLIFFALAGPAVWVIVNAFNYLNQGLFLRANVDISNFGWMMGAGTVISIFGAMGAARVQKRLGTMTPIILSSVLMGIAYLLLAFSTNVVAIVLLIGVLFGSRALRAPIMNSAVNTLVPSEIRATTLSILGMLGTLLTVVLNPVVGYMADRSLTTAFLFCGFTIFGLTFVYYPTLLRVKRSREAQARAAAD